VVSDAIKSLSTKVEWYEGDICSPYRVVIAIAEVGAERVFARMASRAVPAVVANSDCLSKVDVQAKRPRYRASNLGNFECVGKACALVVIRKDEDLGFASETTKS
jgi:hypothetical protein